MPKFVCLLLMLLMTSGCCKIFGICTSFNVHTSASSPDRFASSDPHDSAGSPAWCRLQVSAESGVIQPAAAIASKPHYLPPD